MYEIRRTSTRDSASQLISAASLDMSELFWFHRLASRLPSSSWAFHIRPQPRSRPRRDPHSGYHVVADDEAEHIA